ncbi:FAD-binding oxidoreductase [Parendozoicomonas sp. Alg238-R29]|uniref:FAD-binding oxidoreductase n=1 Tax=Parendozoicomonas sp. Alg238-R29 TaxID=2993446 RepID=UPI00248DC96D|nr:FAD-binding oxidoreductase [Parendozoicomonas sp. Alg238-R29]
MFRCPISARFHALILLFLICFSLSCRAENCTPLQIKSPDHPRELEMIIDEARRKKVRISLLGGGYSQGNQTCANNVIQINIREMNQLISLDIEKNLITVQSGMTWKRLQEHLTPFGLGVAAMQSYSDFSIGGSLGVNAHGQDLHWNPVSSTVESVKVLLTDGRHLHASRTENHDLFRAVIGTYGLVGIITEITLRVVPNHTLLKRPELVKTQDYEKLFFNEYKNNKRLALHSARLSINPLFLFRNVIVVNYYDTGELAPPPLELLPPNLPPAEKINLMKTSWLARFARTTMEFFLYEKSARMSRNQAMGESVVSLKNTVPGTRDILQEYFVPPEQLQPFLNALRNWSKKHQDFELVNATLRWVNADKDSLLPYAPEDRFAIVLFMNLPDTSEAEKAMTKATRELIDLTLSMGGRYYLPYALYASRDQLNRAYPEFEQLLKAKQLWDTGDLLTSKLYQAYAPQRKAHIRNPKAAL